eukprot:TRINITY_DN27155_c0_g1_i1.p1 TRINITY_DN27155_c0_g1~~TRINITY_DN27155_c0_g1_i1.p1  ORF type:complete len:868 (+),score=158.08 TRINITY_DN27155_c0_g1_i1:76-2679(+)
MYGQQSGAMVTPPKIRSPSPAKQNLRAPSPRQVPNRASTPVPDIRKLAGYGGYSPQALTPRQLAAAMEEREKNKEKRCKSPSPQPRPLIYEGPPRFGAFEEQPRHEPPTIIKGGEVDYWSEFNQCWITSRIIEVDLEHGNVFVDVKPTQPLTLQDQKIKLRKRTLPTSAQVSQVSEMLTNCQTESVARSIWNSVCGSIHPATESHSVNLAGKCYDFFGLVGTQLYILQLFRKNEFKVTFQKFLTLFNEIGEAQQRVACAAIPKMSVDGRSITTESSPWTKYKQDKELGKGTYGKVYLARAGATKRAIKQIELEKARGDIKMLKREIANITQLDHPHILKLYEVYATPDALYLVTDLCSGGELNDRLKRAKEYKINIPERWIGGTMLQIMKAVNHIHVRGIVHLDIKAQNIMLMPNQRTIHFLDDQKEETFDSTTLSDFREVPHIVVIDLGVAQNFKPGDFSGYRPAGTPATMAPEVWSGEVTPAADVFSCGCVMFEMLGLTAPFALRFRGDMKEVVQFWKQNPEPMWSKISHASSTALSLTRKMLALDRKDRITAGYALAEEFLNSAGGDRKVSSSPLSQTKEELIARLGTYHRRSLLYKIVALRLARDWPPNQMPTFKRLFSEFDSKGCGTVPECEIEKRLTSHGIERKQAKCAARSMNMAQSEKNTVDWSEFVAACIDLSQKELAPVVWGIFAGIDHDQDQLLEYPDLLKLFPKDHQYSANMASNSFTELTGRSSDEQGVRIDWKSFYGHLRFEAVKGLVDEKFMIKSQNQHVGEYNFLGQMAGAVNDAFQNMFAASGKTPLEQRLAEPMWVPPQKEKTEEEMLNEMEQMGFTSRELNKRALQKNQGNLQLAVECVVEYNSRGRS